MNVHKTRHLAAAGGIARIMGNKWAPMLEAPAEGGGAAPVAEPAETDAKPKPTDAEAALLKEQMKTKTALKEAEAREAALKDRLKGFEGIDPAKARDLQAKADAAAAELRAAEEKRLKDAGDFDGVKKMMADAHAAELKAAKDATAERESKLAEKDGKLAEKDRKIADLTIGRAFRDSDFVKNDLVLTPAKAEKIFGDHFAYEDDKVVAYDKPVSRKTKTMLVDASGNPLSFEDAMKKLVDADSEKDQMLRSKMKDGSGARPVPAPSGQQNRQPQNGELRGVARIAANLKAQAKG